MGFLDKAKEAAEKAMAQGQAKVGSFQQGRSEAELYKTLGEAFYNEQRSGGDRAAVQAGLDALDAHMAAAAAAAQAAAAQQAANQAAAPPAQGYGAPAPQQTYTPPPASAAGTAATSGDFTLDDL
jgi:hypothetical protein